MEQEPVMSARRDSMDLLRPDMSEEKPASRARRDSMDLPPDMSEEKPASRARRDSMDLPPDMSEEKPPSSTRRSLLRPLWEVQGSFQPVYERLRGAPVLGLGVRAAKGWTILGLLASALAVGFWLTVGTLPGGSTAAVGALFVAGAAVALWMVITRWAQRNRRRQGYGNPGC